jgi:hypothetical protein
MRGWLFGILVVGVIALVLVYAQRPDLLHAFDSVIFMR